MRNTSMSLARRSMRSPQLLRYAPEEEVVFRRPDNTPITAREMLRLLQEDDDVAMDFLRSLHGAALRIVRLDARKKGSAT